MKVGLIVTYTIAEYNSEYVTIVYITKEASIEKIKLMVEHQHIYPDRIADENASFTKFKNYYIKAIVPFQF